MENEFKELSYLIRCAPIDIVLGEKKIVWMNDRWYLFNKDKLVGSIQEDKIGNALKWLMGEWWIETQGHDYTFDTDH